MFVHRSRTPGLLLLAVLALGALAGSPLSAVRSRELRGGLFAEVTQPAAQFRATDSTVVRSRLVSIDVGALRAVQPVDPGAAARPSVLLNLFDDLAYNVVVDRVEQAAGGVTWVGHIPGYDLSTVTLASIGDVVSGSIVMQQAVYAIRYVGSGVHEVAQIDQSKFPSELNPIEAPPTGAGMAASSVADGPVLMGDDGSTIDVLVLYTPAAAAAAGGATAIQTRVNLGISEANTSYLNSGIAQRLRLVNSRQVTYSENSDLGQDLYAVGNYNGAVISTPLGDLAASLRDAYGADLVQLITSPPSPNGCGIAWLITGTASATVARYGFSVVEQSCISPNYTFAHELGHNMGARHDWYMDNATTPNTYAHGYVDPPNRFRTVMSYNNVCTAQGFSCTRLLYWSNPAVVNPDARGTGSMGIPGGTKWDCPTGNTSNISCDADDHRTLNERALIVANFRQTSSPAVPAITMHPGNQTVTAGLTATFTAAASGNPAPTVQWQVSTNSGASWSNISGATSTTLAFTAGVVDNGRQYRAVFTNMIGTATTNAATMTVRLPPSITTHPSNATAAAGRSVSFSAAASSSLPTTVQWQVSVDGGVTFANIAGAIATTYTLTAATGDHNKRYRAVFTNAAGSTPTLAAKLSIVGAIDVTPALLRFAAAKAGAAGAVVLVTPAQTVTVTFGGVAAGWTATPNQTWLQVTGGAGTGAGQFAVALVNPGNVIGGSTALTGSVTVTSPTAPNSPVTIPVMVTVDQTGGGATGPPVGLVEAPAQNATGVVGAIGVTGWVVDDVGVKWVRLYRNCLAFDVPANCVSVNGTTAVYVGEATLVAGVRPDIEALYPSYPQANRAAWGYLLLTNLLPHIPSAAMFGGQGLFTFRVLAEDMEGHQRWLGRDFVTINPPVTNEVPTTITLANDAIAKPFGAIDEPAQGATKSGVFYNTGWTLTPDSNTTTDPGDILLPVNGSTHVVYIDGAPVAPLSVYSHCRGTILGPVAAGTYCDDDVSSIFGNSTPLATFTPRSSNPTKYRNLDAGRGAIGAYLLDTRTLSNGIHTIMWGVTDSAGRGDGIGSRYFTVLNATGDAPAGRAPDGDVPVGAQFIAPDRTAGVAGGREASRPDVAKNAATRAQDPKRVGGAPVMAPDRAAEAALWAAPAQSRGDASTLDALQPAAGEVWGRTGFALSEPYEEVVADEAGVRYVRIPDLGRLELWFGDVERGYLVANGTMRDLPIGSRLDPTTGQFTWAPGVGYRGTYRLVFVRGSEQIVVEVTIRPVSAGDSGTRPALDSGRSFNIPPGRQPSRVGSPIPRW